MECESFHPIAKEVRELGYDKDYEGLLPEDFANLTEEELQLLGGDETHSHLIKGLDLALLEKKRKELERQKGILYGLVLVVLGIASSAMSGTVGGTDVQDFVSGILMGLSIVEILAGIGVAGKKLLNQ